MSDAHHYNLEANAQPFNLGCQARIQGRRLAENQFPRGSAGYYSWRAGWKDVNDNFGAEAQTPFRSLPQVRGRPRKGG